MKYLITGGSGFIGSNFIRYLMHNDKRANILNVDRLTYAGNPNNLLDIKDDARYSFIRENICDTRQIEKAFNYYNPDYVINFAAETHVDRSISDPDIFVMSNVVGTQNLLQMSFQHGVKKYLQISTDEVYGSLGKEGLFTEETPLSPRSPYSASKASADLLTRAYFHTFDLPINITRCSNNYGPYQFPEKLIPLTICNCLKGKKIPLYGDGLNIRDWIHVDDHCAAIDMVLREGVPGEVYNVGANNERSNIEIVKLIIEILMDDYPEFGASENLIARVEDRKGHDRRYAIDSTKIMDNLKWKPLVPFERGMKDAVKWYVEQWV